MQSVSESISRVLRRSLSGVRTGPAATSATLVVGVAVMTVVATGAGLVVGGTTAGTAEADVASSTPAVTAVANGSSALHPAWGPVQTEGVSRFEFAACPMDVYVSQTVVCGYLTVPENRSQADGPTVRLPVAVVRSTDPDAAADPIVYTAGGPGGNSMSGQWLANTRLGDDRDVVLFGARGTRHADPELQCPEVERGEALGYEETGGSSADAVEQCHDRLVEAGIDLSAYHTRAIATDLATLRTTLGFEEYNLLGVSYSTRVMLAVLRDHPEGVRSVVIESASPQEVSKFESSHRDFDRSLSVLFENCRADPDCAAAYPDLEAQFLRVVEQYNRDPVMVPITDPNTGERTEIEVSGDGIALGAMGALYSRSVIEYLPFLTDQLDRGNTAVLEPMTDRDVRLTSDVAWGLRYSVECRDDVPFTDPAADRIDATDWRVGHRIFASPFETCEVWDVPPSPPVAHDPVTSDVPTMVVAGSFDPVTPPASSRAVADRFPNATYYEFPRGGHGPSFDTACGFELLAGFYDSPDSPPADDCIASGPPEFRTTEDIAPTGSIYRLNTAVVSTGDPFWLGSLGLAVLALVAGAVGTLVVAWRRTLADAVLVVPGVAAVAVLDISFLALLYGALASTPQFTLAFGLPARVGWLPWLPLLAGVLALGVVVLAARGRDDHSLLEWGLPVVTALGGVAFAAWFGWWGLLPPL